MIEVLHYEPANKNKIIGFVDIKIVVNQFPIIIRRIAHFQSGERRWFNLPNFSREGVDGQKKYVRYWQFETEAHNGALLEKLHDKVKEYCAKNNIKEIEPINFDVPATSMDEVLPF